MSSIPCSSCSAAARRHKLPFIAAAVFPRFISTKFKPTRRRAAFLAAAASVGGDQPPQPRTLFPGGFKRPEIKVPTIVLRVTAAEAVRRAAEIGSAVSRGVGVVVLDGGGGGDDLGGTLYEAACVLKRVMGDRGAYLLVAERVDVAAAVGASGVVLSDQGIPAIVARNMMMNSRSDSVYLPIVARAVQSGKSAVSASSSEGADFLIIDNTGENSDTELDYSITKQVMVPIFFRIGNLHAEGPLLVLTSGLLQSGACGLVISLDEIKLFSDDVLEKILRNKRDMSSMQGRNLATSTMELDSLRNVINSENGFAGFAKLNDKEKQLIEAENELLHEAIAVIQKAAPMMKEVSLLEDAASRLTEQFLLVVVGEFNSGKSTVINALLGRKYLKDGVVPTTNEITLLCYSETDYSEQEKCERNQDGQFMCYLSAPILKEMNLVDTPGTNVILQRQQRLTEEFVPRADLILFVLSSDRPLTESEVAFLQYMQQWKKKVVFILNKVDFYRDASELEEATAFIKDNVRKLINAEEVRLYPVSARSALEAKLSASSKEMTHYEKFLSSDPRWLTSQFDALEKFLLSFLDGSTDNGRERMRIKLQTPIDIADRLLISCQKIVKQQYESAKEDLASIKELVNRANEYAMRMENESISWKKQTTSMIERTKTRVVKLLESVLQLSNGNLIATYAFKGESSTSSRATSAVENEIISPALSDTQNLLEEYSLWLESSNNREGKLYVDSFEKQWHQLVGGRDKIISDTSMLLSKHDCLSIQATEKFTAAAAARLLEQEIRGVVLGTFGGLVAAGLSASLLTSVLQTTLDDLLALALCSSGGWLAISRFSARRNQAIEKVQKMADGLAREIEEAMQNDLSESIEKLSCFVENISAPYQEAAESRINSLSEIQDELTNIEHRLRLMKAEIQKLHVS